MQYTVKHVIINAVIAILTFILNLQLTATSSHLPSVLYQKPNWEMQFNTN